MFQIPTKHSPNVFSIIFLITLKVHKIAEGRISIYCSRETSKLFAFPCTLTYKLGNWIEVIQVNDE